MKDQIKRDLAALLPEDTSDDIITRLSTYVMEKLANQERLSHGGGGAAPSNKSHG